jgi:beta-glucosidase
MNKQRTFPDTFLWGVATASYQIEGAVSEGGRGESIWDRFSHTPGRVAGGHTGDVATDHFHRFSEDIASMRDLGIGAYRFSLAWPRIQPEGGLGSGATRSNQAGLDFYHRLIDELLSAGIEPVVTLYHWDLPQALEDAGGWPERDTAYRFADYAGVCFDAFGDRVRRWITLNEPWCSSILGYLEGVHAPGRQDRVSAYRAIHHLMLGHGLAVRRFPGETPRASATGEPQIGITLNLSTPRPATRRPEDLLAADRAADRDSRMFLNPLLGAGYPERHLSAYPEVAMPVQEGDMEVISGPFDFLGLNYYTEPVVAFDPEAPEEFRTVRSYQEETAMGWPIVPEGLHRQLRWVHQQAPDLPLYVTENGAAFDDAFEDAVEEENPPGAEKRPAPRVRDLERIDYLRGHLAACRRAIDEGIPLAGYFLWSFIDNFEWAFGYTKRFGIVFCDYEAELRRIPKDSYYFYREVVAGHEAVE